jgi:hypothetical protein
LKQQLRKVAKERDQNRLIQDSPLLRAAAHGKLSRASYRTNIRRVHPDTRPKTLAELNQACDQVCAWLIELEKLFQFEKAAF